MTRAYIALLALLVTLVATAAADARVVTHKSGKSPAAVRGYWTAERMQNAIPAERSRTPVERAGKPGSGTSPSTSLEAPLSTPPAHGKVFFSDGTFDYVCSGTALASQNESVVWTAGHCVNEGPGGFYQDFLFVPAYRDGTAPYGEFAGTQLHTTSAWQSSGEYGVDLGAAEVAPNAAGQTLTGAVTTGRPIVFNSPRNQAYKLYGYPAAKRFNGQRLRLCDTAWSRNDTSANPDTMGVPCDMTGGSSGGGWVTAGGEVASVVSYGYSSLKNVLFGPHQETDAQQLFTTAQTP